MDGMDMVFRLPVCITVSRATGQVTGLEWGDVTARDMFGYLHRLERVLRDREQNEEADTHEKLVQQGDGHGGKEPLYVL